MIFAAAVRNQRARILLSLVMPVAILLLAACAKETDLSSNKSVPQFSVNANAGPGGSINPPSQRVAENEAATFSVTPNSNFTIANVTGCGGSLNLNNQYVTAPIVADCNINASFMAANAITHTVSTNAGAGGSLSPANATVNDGEQVSFNVLADANFMIASVSGCNGQLSGTTYTTGPINADCTVTATFQAVSGATHVVSTNAGVGGSINPATATVNDGATTSFTVTSDTNYVIDSVSGCFNGALSGNIYTTGAVTADCTVTASFSRVYTLTSQVSAGQGTVDPGSVQVKDGDVATFNLNPATGYTIDSASGCPGSLTGSSFTTDAIHADCLLAVSFKIRTFLVTTSLTAGGTIAPTSATVNYNDRASFSILPDPHYVIANVSARGCRGQLNGNVYTTGRVTRDCQVSVAFALEQFTVTGVASSGGKITPATQRVSYNESASLSVSADPNYTLVSVSGCGNGNLANGVYTTAAITGDCQVDATFAAILFTVNAQAGAGGSISPSGASQVMSGSRISFTVIPDANFQIDLVSGCGGSLMPASGSTPASYTVASINADCTIVASFSAQTVSQFTVSATSGNGGSINPSSIDVAPGANVSFDLQPNAGFRVDTVSGCKGQLSNNSNTYTTSAINNNCDVSAFFVTDNGGVFQTVNGVVGVGGDVTPTAIRLLEGSQATFTISPDVGFQLASVSPNGCDGALNGSQYQTQDISNDCVITFNFTATAVAAAFASSSLLALSSSYTVYAQSSVGGSVSPLISNTLAGNSVDIVITPEVGYEIVSASGCGGVLNGNLYTTAAMSAAYNGCTVDVQFAALP